MNVLALRVRAPFAAFRWLQAGVFRASSPVIPPSAAWGLVLNVAGVETRGADVDGTTSIRPDAPAIQLAIATVSTPETASLYQQLHSYPVGNSGKERQAGAHGSKYWIAPARRELLVGFDAVIAVRAADQLLDAVRAGVRGETSTPRYGLLHAGDNNLLVDQLDLLVALPVCRWYAALRSEEPPRAGSCRLTVAIDREDSSRTRTCLYAPLTEPTAEPPEAAWTWVPRAPE